MLTTEREKLRNKITKWIEKFGGDRSALIPVLQEIQQCERCISEYAMQEVADQLDIHPVEIYGVVSFYSFLYTEPQGKFVIRLCRTISCDMAGKDRIARQLENDLEIKFGETTEDGLFTLEWANCLGLCDQGPAMLINEHVFTKVAPDQVHDILQVCRHSIGASAVEAREEYLV